MFWSKLTRELSSELQSESFVYRALSGGTQLPCMASFNMDMDKQKELEPQEEGVFGSEQILFIVFQRVCTSYRKS